MPYNLLSSLTLRTCQTNQPKHIPSSPATQRSPTFPSFFRPLHRGSNRSQKTSDQPPTRRYQQNPIKMENSNERLYSRRDSQPPPAYDATPAGDTRTNPYPYDPRVENPQLLSPSTIGRSTRRRSTSRATLDAIKGLFMMNSGKESKNSSSSRSSLPSTGLAADEHTGVISGVNIIGKMTIQIAASPQAMQALQEPSPGVTPRSEAPSSSSRHPLQPVTPRGGVQIPDGYFPPQRRATTLATDDELLALKDFDTQFLIDDSGSMRLSTSTIAKNKTHWEQVKYVLSDIVKVCAEFDENGVDVYFFNSSLVGQFNRTNLKDPNEVMELFEARYQAGIRGSTPTAEALDLIVAPYLKECERHVEDKNFPKKRNIIVMTDGAANNNKLLKQNLISYAKRLDMIQAPTDQIGVQFFQVGNVEGVDEFLNYLDNALSEENECRDFIDTRSSEDMGAEGLTARRVLTTVLGGVNRSKSIVISSTTESDLAAKNGPQNHRKRPSKKRDGNEKGKKSREAKLCDNDGKIRGEKDRKNEKRERHGKTGAKARVSKGQTSS